MAAENSGQGRKPPGSIAFFEQPWSGDFGKEEGVKTCCCVNSVPHRGSIEVLTKAVEAWRERLQAGLSRTLGRAIKPWGIWRSKLTKRLGSWRVRKLELKLRKVLTCIKDLSNLSSIERKPKPLTKGFFVIIPSLSKILSQTYIRATKLIIVAAFLTLASQLYGGNRPDQPYHLKFEVSFQDFLVPNYCTDEIINEKGTITAWYQITQDGQGRIHFRYHEHFQATGVGSFGNDYVIQDQYKIKLLVFEDMSARWTETFEFVQISKGGEENSKFYQTLEFILKPDGTLEVNILKSQFDCRG